MDPELVANLMRWEELRAVMETWAIVIEEEKTVRAAIFAKAFPKPKEGVNNYDIGKGWKLVGKYQIKRTLDEAVLPTILPIMAKAGVTEDTLVKYTPELIGRGYKALPDNLRKVFDQAVVSKPQSPQIEMVGPK